MRMRLLICLLFTLIGSSAWAQQCSPSFPCGTGWRLLTPTPITIVPTTPGGNGQAIIEFQQVLSDTNPFFSSWTATGANCGNGGNPFPNCDFSLGAGDSTGQQPCAFGQPVPSDFCFMTITFSDTTGGPEQGDIILGGSLVIQINGEPFGFQPPEPGQGKWVFFESVNSPTALGKNCFDAPAPAYCFQGYYDLTSDGTNVSSPANPLNPGSSLALDNSLCNSPDSVYPNISGQISGNNISLHVAEDANGSVYVFQGTIQNGASYTGFNLDGTSSGFSGFTTEISGTNNDAGAGCSSHDDGEPFEAWFYPSLGSSASVTLNVLSQPGSLNIPVTMNISLDESAETNSDFSVSATGTISGTGGYLATCGPLTFTSVDGQAIGDLYGIDFDYKTASGATGTGSIGLSLVTPFIVPQAALQAAGYQASGDGYALQVWSIDWSASSDGCVSSDPIRIGNGVAYPKSEHAHEHRKDRDRNRKDLDWKDFWKHRHDARTSEENHHW